MIFSQNREPEEKLSIKVFFGGHPLSSHLALVLVVPVGDGVVDPLVAGQVVGLLRVKSAKDVDFFLFYILPCLREKCHVIFLPNHITNTKP